MRHMSRYRHISILIILFSLILVTSCSANTSQSQSTPASPSGLTSITLKEALSNGKPTVAEFGRGTCIPCQQMKPILENLAAEYKDKLNVPIVNVDEYRALTNYYQIMAIPTQICFDSSGKEVLRHVGYWPKDKIITELSKLGLK